MATMLSRAISLAESLSRFNSSKNTQSISAFMGTEDSPV